MNYLIKNAKKQEMPKLRNSIKQQKKINKKESQRQMETILQKN